MKNKTLYLMVGIPGSGKSTYAIKFMDNRKGWTYISRDEIRFSLLSPDEEYFAKEDLVFRIFIDKINDAMYDGNIFNIIIDATHLNTASRMKVLNRINTNKCNVVPIIMNTALDDCIERNNLRSGRARVPESVIRNMFRSMTHPRKDNFPYAGYMEVTV